MGKEPSIDEILASLNELLGNQISNQDVADNESDEEKRAKARALLDDLRHINDDDYPEPESSPTPPEKVEVASAIPPVTEPIAEPTDDATVFSPVEGEEDSSQRMLLTREMLLETTQAALPFRRLGDKPAHAAAPTARSPAASEAPVAADAKASTRTEVAAPAVLSEDELEQLIQELSDVLIARFSQQVPALVREVILQYLPPDIIGNPPADSPLDKK